MIGKKVLNARRTWIFLAGLTLIGSGLFSAQVFKYKRTKPETGYLIPDVPAEKWLKRNYCGPACLAMVLNYWDKTRSFSQQKITDEIYDSENQVTYNSELVLYPRTQGFESYSFQGDLQTLKDVISENIPVIVLTKPIKQIPKGHYRVVIGFDDSKKQIIFHDPYFGGRRAMKYKNFLKVWTLGKDRNRSNWMMAVVPAQRSFPFPALQNDPLTSINLATAYYRRTDFTRSKEQWEKVRISLEKDPYPLYSLAMVSLREGKHSEAETYALEAIRLDENCAYAHDVLGLAYINQHKIVQALESLEKAVRLAPDKTFIRNHYLQVKALQIEKTQTENMKK